jgi:hypothetical protein
LDTVVAVIAVVGGAEVFELEVGRQVNVSVAVVLVRVPVIGRDAVVEVGVSAKNLSGMNGAITLHGNSLSEYLTRRSNWSHLSRLQLRRFSV